MVFLFKKLRPGKFTREDTIELTEDLCEAAERADDRDVSIMIAAIGWLIADSVDKQDALDEIRVQLHQLHLKLTNRE